MDYLNKMSKEIAKLSMLLSFLSSFGLPHNVANYFYDFSVFPRGISWYTYSIPHIRCLM